MATTKCKKCGIKLILLEGEEVIDWYCPLCRDELDNINNEKL